MFCLHSHMTVELAKNKMHIIVVVRRETGTVEMAIHIADAERTDHGLFFTHFNKLFK